ncbi:hypothetical protein [Mycolicibacterium porcinum]|uniref:hypothetical protein n=1 Tax=Mycolicibacterium porcinum TaxID=39693 RepID=UPI0008483963|nr:hypothetical protein [Mycolicibacterium porcinum]ODR25781.1 hypothetical protein BHQ19_10405 [Mycolicibacterium porcinum]
MTTPLGSYSFLPWLRQGISRTVTAQDGDRNVKLRATTPVEVTLTGTPLPSQGPLSRAVKRDIELYGPGEVVGIDTRAVIRTVPRPWITDVEPNYLAHIEFYDEDFPWRYTPHAPQGLRLRPWIAVVVLKETAEFDEGASVSGQPLPFISVKNNYNHFPPVDGLWAWAHVHSNQHLGASPGDLVAGDAAAAVSRLEAALATNRDAAYSRIVCPRRLETNSAYHAFLVPTFERGRLAGLGIDPDKAPFATALAWAEYDQYQRPESLNMPYYHRWYFRTGGEGDFESLVRLLKWRTVDPRLGYRDVDVLDPGSNIKGITDPALNGVLRLGGALRAPRRTLSQPDRDARDLYEKWWRNTYPSEWQQDFAKFINLGDQFTRQAAAPAKQDAEIPPADPDDVDPIVTAPLYGEWQALQHRLLKNPDNTDISPNNNWIHHLNLSPPYRVAGAFGGDVVRKHQEDYMEAAWKQVGEVLAHNQKARVALTALHAGNALYAKTLTAATNWPTRVLSLTAGVQTRVLTDGVTLGHARQLSITPAVLTSSTMRRIVRPQGPIARRLELDKGPHAGRMLEAVNDGKITASPPKEPPSGLATVEEAAKAVAPQRRWPPEWLSRLDRRAPWLKWLLLALAVVLLVLAALGGPVFILLVAAAVAFLFALALALAGRVPTVSEAIGADMDNPDIIDRLPGPNFVFGIDQPPVGGTGPDNDAARRFKAALKDWATFAKEADAAGRPTPLTKLDLVTIADTAAGAVKPVNAIPRRFLAGVDIADHVRNQVVDVFDEIRYYPRIDEPMYRPLKGLGDDCFVPNLSLIERDTVVALETNQAFIEAYMVGVNHEFSRELLWREYPTDMRGTYFRQFWDVTSHLTTATDDAARDKLYDIPPIHTWLRSSDLGEHDNRQTNPGEPADEVVLVVRGELLKKYPNTVVYAHKADWARKENGEIDPSKERLLVDLVGDELQKPPPEKVRTPIYDAKVDPDIYFFGFDLKVDEVKGGDADPNAPGWFFVLKERPSEPRFGFDISRDGDIVTVNDLTWNDAQVSQPGAFLDSGALSTISLTPPIVTDDDDDEKQPQYDDDVKIVNAPVSAARWAYLLYQMPVMVAVHGAELLKDGGKY